MNKELLAHQTSQSSILSQEQGQKHVGQSESQACQNRKALNTYSYSQVFFALFHLPLPCLAHLTKAYTLPGNTLEGSALLKIERLFRGCYPGY